MSLKIRQAFGPWRVRWSIMCFSALGGQFGNQFSVTRFARSSILNVSTLKSRFAGSSGTHFCNVRFQLLGLPGLQVLIFCSALFCGSVLLCSVVLVVIDIDMWVVVDIDILVIDSLIFNYMGTSRLPQGAPRRKTTRAVRCRGSPDYVINNIKFVPKRTSPAVSWLPVLLQPPGSAWGVYICLHPPMFKDI